MSIDLTTMAPKARAEYLRIGRQYGSTDTLHQANKTLGACKKYGEQIKHHGFGARDEKRLEQARDELIERGIGRTEQTAERKATTKAFGAAQEQGKLARETARAVLEAVVNEIAETGDEKIAERVEAALDVTRLTQSDAEKLATQLDVLRGVMVLEQVAQAAKDRGGPESEDELKSAAKALREAAKERALTGTAGATETIDIVDGIIVKLARSARKAARAAARKLKQPAIAAAFELTHLYGSRGTGDEDEAPEETPEKPA